MNQLLFQNYCLKNIENLTVKNNPALSTFEVFIPESKDFKDFFSIEKFPELNNAIDFLSINPFVFNFSKVESIKYVSISKTIIIKFYSFFSNETTLQFNIEHNKVNLFINNVIFSINNHNKNDISKFNLLCYKFSTRQPNLKIKLGTNNIKLNKINKFLSQENVPYSEVHEGFIQLLNIVEY